MSERRQCVSVSKLTGERCKKNITSGTGSLCFSHDPKNARKRQIICKVNSQKKHVLNAEDVPAPPKTMEELLTVVSESINHARTGRLDYKQCEAIAKLAKVQIELLQAAPKEDEDADIDAMTDAECKKAIAGQLKLLK